jgi:probable phosphoglycerate mutase
VGNVYLFGQDAGKELSMLIFYIRHGDPIYDPDQLTPLGHRQAESVAHRLALFGVDEVYASTSNRAMQTAQPTCELLNKEMKTLDFLNENNLEGLHLPVEGNKQMWVWVHPDYAHILTRRDVRELGDRWYEHPELKKFGFEKSIQPVTAQLDAFLASHGYEHDTDLGLYRVRERHHEKRIAIFAHESMGKIVMSHLLDVPFPHYAAHFEMHTSGLTVIRLDDESFGSDKGDPADYARARLLTLSNDAHLYHEGLSLTHRFTHLRAEY